MIFYLQVTSHKGKNIEHNPMMISVGLENIPPIALFELSLVQVSCVWEDRKTKKASCYAWCVFSWFGQVKAAF